MPLHANLLVISSILGAGATPVSAQVVRDAEYLANYGLDFINPLPAYNLGLTGQGITIGIVDTGVETTHQEFTGRISPNSRNFGIDYTLTDATDHEGHGTGVAGIAAAARNGIGMEGVAFGATIVSLRAIGVKTSDDQTEDPTTRAINYAAQQHLGVLNGSYGPDAAPPTTLQDPAFPDDPKKQIPNPNYAVISYQPILANRELIADYQAVKAAAAADVVMVFAAGNEYREQPIASANPDGVGLYPYITPAHHETGVYRLLASTQTLDFNNPSTYQALSAANPIYQQADFADLHGSLIVVVALSHEGTIAEYSNRCGVAAAWCLAAPGGSGTTDPSTSIYSAGLNGGYDSESGTSEAAPFVSGAAAILRQEFPFLNAHQIIETILTTATDLGSPEIYGQGLLNLGKAVGGPGKFRDAVFDVDTQGYNSTWSNDIIGIGGLTKRGAGILQFTGADSYSGPTRIVGGTLKVDGSIVSATTIGSGGILAGTGRVGSVIVGSEGTIAPGDGIAKLTVGGDIAFLVGSTYSVKYSPGGGADLLDISGIATIAPGSNVLATQLGVASLKLGMRYTILTAAGGVSGTYSTVTGSGTNLAFIGVGLGYDSSDVYLQVGRNAVPFATFATTPNQVSAAMAIDTLPGSNSVYNSVVYLADGRRASNLYNLASGEIHASIKSAMIDDSRYIREALLNRFNTVSLAKSAANGGLWAQGIGSWGQYDTDGNATRLSQSNVGGLIGTDIDVSDWKFGVAGSYRKTKAQVDDRLSSASIDNYEIGGFLGRRWGSFSLQVGAAHDWQKVNTDRTIAFDSLSQKLTARYDARVLQGFGEVGFAFTGATSELEPFANLAYVRLHTDGIFENGGDAALTAAGDKSDATFLTAGAHSSIGIGGTQTHFAFLGTAAWKHAFGNVLPRASLAFSQGNDFVVAGIPLARDAIALDFGIEATLARGLTLSVTYNGQLAQSVQDNGGRINLAFRF